MKNLKVNSIFDPEVKNVVPATIDERNGLVICTSKYFKSLDNQVRINNQSDITDKIYHIIYICKLVVSHGKLRLRIIREINSSQVLDKTDCIILQMLYARNFVEENTIPLDYVVTTDNIQKWSFSNVINEEIDLSDIEFKTSNSKRGINRYFRHLDDYGYFDSDYPDITVSAPHIKDKPYVVGEKLERNEVYVNNVTIRVSKEYFIYINKDMRHFHIGQLHADGYVRIVGTSDLYNLKSNKEKLICRKLVLEGRLPATVLNIPNFPEILDQSSRMLIDEQITAYSYHELITNTSIDLYLDNKESPQADETHTNDIKGNKDKSTLLQDLPKSMMLFIGTPSGSKLFDSKGNKTEDLSLWKKQLAEIATHDTYPHQIHDISKTTTLQGDALIYKSPCNKLEKYLIILNEEKAEITILKYIDTIVDNKSKITTRHIRTFKHTNPKTLLCKVIVMKLKMLDLLIGHVVPFKEPFKIVDTLTGASRVYNNSMHYTSIVMKATLLKTY